MTDGRVTHDIDQVQFFSTTSHLPSILVIFKDPSYFKKCPMVAQCNVSLLMPVFLAAQTAAVLVIGDSDSDRHARLIDAKGGWSKLLATPPVLNDDLRVIDCPIVTIERILELLSTVDFPSNPGTLMMDNGLNIDLKFLGSLRNGTEFLEIVPELMMDNGLNIDLKFLGSLRNGTEFLEIVPESALNELAWSFFTSGEIEQWRTMLKHWLFLADKVTTESVRAATLQSTRGVHSLLQLLTQANNDVEQNSLKKQLQKMVMEGSIQGDQARNEANQSTRSTRVIINAALASISVFDKSGVSSIQKGSLSNRCRRARVIDRDSIAAIASLNFLNSPHEEDLIMQESGPVALCLRRMENVEMNTNNDALVRSFQVGQENHNAVFEPTIVSSSIADRIDKLGTSPLTRNDLSICLPIISLQSEFNRNAVKERLCLVFMNGLSMSHVWLIALGCILKTLETEQWAGPDEPTGRILQWFGCQIMKYVVLGAGSRFSPDLPRTINQALLSVYQTERMIVNYSIPEVSCILRLLQRFGDPGTISDESLRRSMLATIAASVPKRHRRWLLNIAEKKAVQDIEPSSRTALTSAIYEIDSNGVRVACHLVKDFESIFTPVYIDAIESFAQALNIHSKKLITPGLALVVAATLEHIINHQVKSSAAVKMVRKVNLLVGAEMDPMTAGRTTDEESLTILRQGQL
eukprot:CAMPEP_0194399282 /NCGR_PEP_ID=MMETSP0174-20130528/126574_1 /TAXON_ID=216777 /ORGANISM="Proboscia alata, Strain PI-D3" /LENGTH=690 /DNA_ID=CAMNT_0039195675 /DNA_START=427 /DNA_END=2500 /DNA_ORIENTATION=+